jgi:hypothetical protein
VLLRLPGAQQLQRHSKQKSLVDALFTYRLTAAAAVVEILLSMSLVLRLPNVQSSTILVTALLWFSTRVHCHMLHC